VKAASGRIAAEPVVAAPVVAEPVETQPELDLIDRIANALPDEVRAEYYRELRHCRSLHESDEMLRLLRAMQFLVLLIEQAPSRIAAERERLDKLLAAAIDNINKMSKASEAWHVTLQRRLTALPADIASGISPEAVADKINENLRREFVRSTIPQTADALAGIADRMKNVCSEFSTTSDSLGSVYRGSAEDARKAVASLQAEISQAMETAARFTREIAEKSSKLWRWSLVMIAGGSLVIGLAIGMELEHWLLSPAKPVVESAAPAVRPAPEPSPNARMKK
jgi:chromosome segregation ATPase